MILQSVKEHIHKPRKEFREKYDGLDGADLCFYKSYFKGKYNLKKIDAPTFKKYLDFLHLNEIIFPAGYIRSLILLDEFEYLDYKKTTPIFVNYAALIHALQYLKREEKEYILKSKRIIFNIFTGRVTVNLKNGRQFPRTVRESKLISGLLKAFLAAPKNYLSLTEIQKIGGDMEPRSKIYKLRKTLGITKSESNEIESPGITIVRNKNGYKVVES